MAATPILQDISDTDGGLLPTDAVREALDSHGPGLLDDPMRLHAVLTERLPGSPQEVDAISWAAHDAIPAQLRAAGAGHPGDAEVGRLSAAFAQDRGFPPAIAATAVRALADALHPRPGATAVVPGGTQQPAPVPVPPARRRRRLVPVLAGAVALVVLAAAGVVGVVVLRHESATVTALHGGVHLVRKGSEVTVSTKGTGLESGDTVRTDGARSLAEIRLASGGVIRLDEYGGVALTKLPKKGLAAVALVRGRAWLHTTGQQIELTVAKAGSARLPKGASLVADCRRVPSCDLMSVGGQAAVTAGGKHVALSAARSLSLPDGQAPGAARLLSPDQILLSDWLIDSVDRDRKLGLPAAKAAVRDPQHGTLVGQWKVTTLVKATKESASFPGDRYIDSVYIAAPCATTPCEITADFGAGPTSLAYDGTKYSYTDTEDSTDCNGDKGHVRRTFTIVAGSANANAEAGSFTGSQLWRGVPKPGSGCGVLERTDTLNAVRGAPTAQDFPNDAQRSLMFDSLVMPRATCVAADPLPTGAEAGISCRPPGPAAEVSAWHFTSATTLAAAYLGWAKKGGAPRGIPCGSTSSPWRGESVVPGTPWRLMCYRDSGRHEWAVLSNSEERNLFVVQGGNASYDEVLGFAIIVLGIEIPAPPGSGGGVPA